MESQSDKKRDKKKKKEIPKSVICVNTTKHQIYMFPTQMLSRMLFSKTSVVWTSFIGLKEKKIIEGMCNELQYVQWGAVIHFVQITDSWTINGLWPILRIYQLMKTPAALLQM